MSLDQLIVITGLAVAGIFAALLRYAIRAQQQSGRTKARHDHYDNYAFVYDHPRSAR